jgi:uncharacterized protein (DUF608 family)
MSTRRRTFLKQVALASVGTPAAAQTPPPAAAAPTTSPTPPEIAFPRVFTGRRLTAIAFPLGGVCAGCVSLGGHGQLRDWEISNRTDKGNAPSYAFPAIWARADNRKPVARVLESRIQPPFEGASGLGARNAPGLTRLASATFIGEFPLARIDSSDSTLPVRVSLEAFSPFTPHEPDESGLPVAILRYRVTNRLSCQQWGAASGWVISFQINRLKEHDSRCRCDVVKTVAKKSSTTNRFDYAMGARLAAAADRMSVLTVCCALRSQLGRPFSSAG